MVVGSLGVIVMVSSVVSHVGQRRTTTPEQTRDPAGTHRGGALGRAGIDFAVDGARRMSVLINDLLAFSRVGRGNVAPAPQDCESLLTAALGNLEKVITETGARVTHDALPTVPGVGSLLTTLLQNLVGNGLKFRGSEPPRIHVGVERDGEHWSFRVTDNGIGIDPAYAKRIFVIFQRLHAKADYPGTGIPGERAVDAWTCG
jgi:light-regulated signal transduction histidine kinase (bacteriophytochrome)